MKQDAELAHEKSLKLRRSRICFSSVIRWERCWGAFNSQTQYYYGSLAGINLSRRQTQVEDYQESQVHRLRHRGQEEEVQFSGEGRDGQAR